jgi:2-amino-4-hydroxy-6-hydroxymethyldihydropteridine diphosphokinase
MHTAYLSLGSNQGNRALHLAEACDLLSEHQIKIIRRSPIYETAPWGFVADTLFLNAVIEVTTPLDPYALHRAIMEVESALGRTRVNLDPVQQPYVSRSIDLDVLFFDDLILTDHSLTIPHPRLHMRNFVLVPMVDLASGFRHPLLNLRMDELLAASIDAADARYHGPWPEHTIHTVVSIFT